ncbi:MAG: DUF4297 domain-containing protein [Flavobacteriaceae bacterium]|nr:DUF4297 domain-containing protein [Flavobacteriaceae bacterium]
MTNNYNSEVNAGVHVNIGMDFQKNCTIYLFLEKYNQLQNQKYFIILEHLEDVVFGYLDNQIKLSKIETYQAKKSSSKWTNSGLLEIIKKITETSQSVLNDPHPKTADFSQSNFFATNNTIELKCKVDKQQYSCLVNESNEHYKYSDLNQNIKNKIQKGSKDVNFTSENICNFDTLNFRFIDLGRTPKAQLEQLDGKFRTVFGENIADHKAALYSFYFALMKIEKELNQGNIAKLSDNKKRIDSNQIDSIINILTNKKKAFDFWREKKDELCEELKISLFDVPIFELHYENSFDKFKDINESEHNKIFDFVLNNKAIFKSDYTDRACIASFHSKFNREKSSTLSELQLKAVIAAAYIEVKNTL